MVGLLQGGNSAGHLVLRKKSKKKQGTLNVTKLGNIFPVRGGVRGRFLKVTPS